MRAVALRDLVTLRGSLGAALIVFGALSALFPDPLAARAYLLAANPGANIWLIRGFGLALVAGGAAVLSEPWHEDPTPSRPVLLWLAGFLPILCFLALSLHLRDWWIDDAGITFAYSRSLAAGQGLVAQPWLAPEEGYSSSIWMLLLSVMARLGFDIAMAAKSLGTAFSALAMGLCAVVLARETRRPLALVLCGIGIATGPTVVWAASGQEHALQSLLLLALVLCTWHFEHWRWPVAAVLSLLVLTRPEAPIIVISVFLAGVFLTRRGRGRLINAGDIALALLPFVTFVGLMIFRKVYFGDFLPNPYYAKSSGAGLAGVLNPLGGGWAYILAGLRDSALLVVLGLVVFIRSRPLPRWVVVAIAVLIAQAVFVIWAKGDWMGQYRFLMPVLPVALLVACSGLCGLPSVRARAGFTIAAVLILSHTTALQLSAFKSAPTTPLAVVAQVGHTFRALSDRLEIDDPLLAHHDAGAIAYERMIRLLDLGGLIDRTVARNIGDRAFLTDYLVEEMQPDFVFGARNFAAASGFAETEAFAQAYVPLEFVDLPALRSDLSYIRRSRVVPARGIEPIYDAAGALVGVRADLRP